MNMLVLNDFKPCESHETYYYLNLWNEKWDTFTYNSLDIQSSIPVISITSRSYNNRIIDLDVNVPKSEGTWAPAAPWLRRLCSVREFGIYKIIFKATSTAYGRLSVVFDFQKISIV